MLLEAASLKSFAHSLIYEYLGKTGVKLADFCGDIIGALLILVCLRPLSHKPLRVGRVNVMPVVVFVAVVALTTVVELIASYLLEWTTGGWLWDYTRYSIQWQGRICLSASLRFGVVGMIILYGLQPLLEKGMARLGKRWRQILFVVLFVLFVVDCVSRVLR